MNLPFKTLGSLPKLHVFDNMQGSISNIGNRLNINTIPKMDFFDNVKSFMDNITSKLQGLSLSVVVCCICITGLMFLFGEGPSRTAKKWLTYIVIGALITFGASTLGDTIKSVGGF
ncbi:TrbC/VirB2 family protein [Clostridium sporogenes]|uniref:TrbC/VirB2 family protein n=1 Tax=Clostridium sporogenes TaxID=1509 RepID=UPI000729A1A5|nr:TrbC/VirB2 family protein [Clostridium sporogenes]KRU39992.1 TrbC/VIRB2 family protein [Clostridium sporogenes]MCW6064739.1 TrbC/VirB2 family protein [Clostridium sporogenes]OQP88534.1 TrbC/VIRB2 family protein [Clostridium sporogenes]